MSYFQSILVFVLLFAGLSNARVVDKNELDRVAIELGYGYKYANLQQLASLSEEKFGAYRIAVPDFDGITSSAVQNYLRSLIDVQAVWSGVVSGSYAGVHEQAELFKSGKFSDTFLADAKLLREALSSAFDIKIIEAKSLNRIEGLGTAQLAKFIEEAARSKLRLMVRSSGKEDTKEVANAGGNESVANVEPGVVPFLEALKTVVISYFGEKSLKQRLLAGDASLFDEIPFTPVVVQIMIGETNKAQLPKCGVMFTEDAESGISRYEILNDQGAIKTTGITLIQSAYGHNEGVVNSLIPVDTYYVDAARRVYPIVRPKTYRMMPTARSGELVLVKNDGSLVSRQALNSDAIMTLKALADRLEEFYQGPMDVEFVVDEMAQVIYLVQARPIVHKKDLLPPSYIRDKEAIKDLPQRVGSAIGVAGGGLRVCTKNQSVIAQDIGKALANYQAHDTPKDVGCVIVGRHAPSTSHEATSFRSDGKPVVFIEDWHVVEHWLETTDARIMLSPQQHLVANWPSDDELLATVLAQGWMSYPASPRYSLLPTYTPHEDLTEEAIQSIYPALRDKQRWRKLAMLSPRVNLRGAFDDLRSADDERVQLALATILFKLRESIRAKTEGVILDDNHQARIRLITRAALGLSRDVLAQLEYKPDHVAFSKRLLPVHFLQTLFYQQPDLGEIVRGDSVASIVAKELAVEQRINRDLIKRGVTLKNEASAQLLKVGEVALTPDLSEQWFSFVTRLDAEADVELMNNFAKLILKLGHLELLELWFHTSFITNPDARALVDEYDQMAPSLAILTAKRNIVDALSISGFASAKSFQTLWDNFERELLSYFASGDFLITYQSASKLGKLAMVSVMSQLVNKFDLGIKELKASGAFDDGNKLARFRTMLDGYYRLLRNLVELYPPYVNAGHFERLHRVLTKAELTKADLDFSPGFDVSSFSFGSATSLGRASSPETLEDTFSAIHQDLQALLSALTMQAGAAHIPRPALLAKMESTLSLGKLIGVDLKKGEMVLRRNKSLREHGVQYALTYQQRLNQVILHCRFSGQNENTRWDRVANFFATLKLAGIYDVREAQVKRNGVEYKMVLSGDDDLGVLNEIITKTEWATTALASSYGGADYLSIKTALKIANPTRSLPAVKDIVELMKGLEREIGHIAMSKGYDTSRYLEVALKKDPVFGEQLAKRVYEYELHPPAESKWRYGDSHFLRNMIDTLVSHGHAFGLAATWATHKMQSKYDDDNRFGMAMFKNLIRQHAVDYYDTAAQAAVGLLLKPIEAKKKSFFIGEPESKDLGIFEELFKEGRGAKIALDGAKRALLSENKAVNDAGLKLIELLKHHFKDTVAVDLARVLSEQPTGEVKVALQKILVD